MHWNKLIFIVWKKNRSVVEFVSVTFDDIVGECTHSFLAIVNIIYTRIRKYNYTNNSFNIT